MTPKSRPADERPAPHRGAGRARCLVAPLLALLICSCATHGAEAPPPEAVQVPSSGTDSEDGSDSAEAVTIEPNVVSFDDYRDPLRPANRAIFAFNSVIGRYFLIPVGKTYDKYVPEVVDRRVNSFFKNAATPISVVNHLLQGEPGDSGNSLARFMINSTLGLLGLFDPAREWFDLERRPTDFAATLAGYDRGYGIYLVLPFFGPSDLRNATSRGVDYFLHPIPYVLDGTESFAVMSFGFFQDFAPNAEALERLYEESDDPYTFFRNLHLQAIQRDAAYRK